VPAPEPFTEEDWTRLMRAPLLVGMAITLADPSGPVGALKESTAALQTLLRAAEQEDHGLFVRAVATDAAALARERVNLLAGFKPPAREARQAVLDELRGVYAILHAKASEDDLHEFREFLRVAGQRTALAAKEGTFLGIGGERVSEAEQEMLETVGELFGVPR
jgi:hypothetical protein